VLADGGRQKRQQHRVPRDQLVVVGAGPGGPGLGQDASAADAAVGASVAASSSWPASTS
jgi:hypothetical protein